MDQIETIKHFAEEKFSYMFSILKDFPPPPDVISSGVLVNKISKKKKKKCMPWFIVFVNFHGVNVPTMANFKPPTVEKPVHQIPES